MYSDTALASSRPDTTATGGVTSWFRRAEAWLDARGRGAWIAAMVLGFVFVWPVGLAFVAYITLTNRWSSTMFSRRCGHRRETFHAAAAMARPSGNAAFDAYKAETLRRLQDEQTAFESFLQRLRDAKDKQEFDRFMDERAHQAAAPADAGDAPRAGAY
jgi:hypothetical protein